MVGDYPKLDTRTQRPLESASTGRRFDSGHAMWPLVWLLALFSIVVFWRFAVSELKSESAEVVIAHKLGDVLLPQDVFVRDVAVQHYHQGVISYLRANVLTQMPMVTAQVEKHAIPGRFFICGQYVLFTVNPSNVAKHVCRAPFWERFNLQRSVGANMRFWQLRDGQTSMDCRDKGGTLAAVLKGELYTWVYVGALGRSHVSKAFFNDQQERPIGIKGQSRQFDALLGDSRAFLRSSSTLFGGRSGFCRSLFHLLRYANQFSVDFHQLPAKHRHCDGCGHSYDSQESRYSRIGIVLVLGIVGTWCLVWGLRSPGHCDWRWVLLGWVLYKWGGFIWFYDALWAWLRAWA